MKFINTVGTAKPSIDGTWVNYGQESASGISVDNCPLDITTGEILVSGSNMSRQQSCVPHAYNEGNFYNLLAVSTDRRDPAYQSICSKGWRLPDNDTKFGYSNLLVVYGIDYLATTRKNPDAALLNLPLSFMRVGHYAGAEPVPFNRGTDARYWTVSRGLYFQPNGLDVSFYMSSSEGHSLRCVAPRARSPTTQRSIDT